MTAPRWAAPLLVVALLAAGMAGSSPFRQPAGAAGQRRSRVIEIAPVVRPAAPSRSYVLIVRGTAALDSTVDPEAKWTDTVAAGDGIIALTATRVDGAWRVSGSDTVKVTSVLSGTGCREDPYTATGNITVRATGIDVDGIDVQLTTAPALVTPGVCHRGVAGGLPVPLGLGTALTSALLHANPKPFPVEGGRSDPDPVEGGNTSIGLSYRLTMLLSPVTTIPSRDRGTVAPPAPLAGRSERAAGDGAGAGLLAVRPTRIVDTRPAPDRVGVAGRLGGGQTMDVTVAGRSPVPADAVAVVINATVTGPGGDGYLTVYPTGSARPVVSNVNFVAGQTVPNLVQVKLGAGGAVTAFNGGGAPTDVILDVVAYYAPGGAMYVPSIPGRSFDLSVDSSGPVTAVMTPDNIEGNTVRAVARNVTLDAPAADGFLTVFPTDTPSLSSNLNFLAGQTVANAVISGTSDDRLGAQPAQSVSYLVGSNVPGARLIVDTLGRFVDDDGSGDGRFVPVEPCRALDTRPAPDRRGDVAGPVVAGRPVTMALAGRCGLPGAAAIGSVALNVTAVNPTEAGYLTLWTGGEEQPPTSTVNFRAGQTVANHTITYTSDAGEITALLNAGRADVVIDVFGYYTS